MENNNPNPNDPNYQSKVYKALKDNLEGFDKSEEEFREALKDKKYQSNVYKALKDNLQGFDKSEQEFYSLVSYQNPPAQKKNPNQSGDSNSAGGFSGFPSPKSATDIVLEGNRQVAQQKPKNQNNFNPSAEQPDVFKNEYKDPLTGKIKKTTPTPSPQKTKGEYAKEIFQTAKANIDNNLTEERLKTEKEQSGFLNTVGDIAKSIWNVTGTGLSTVNEALGGTKDYFVIDEYKPLQDEKREYLDIARRDNLPTTPEAVQKGAEDIFRKRDKIQQIQKNIDAALPENYDREGIWKELKLENLKKNDALKQAVITTDVFQSQLEEFKNYAEKLKALPKDKITAEMASKYNSLLDDAKEAQEGLQYMQKSFPTLLKEVKSSDELLDVMKYNYNDYEKAFSNVKNFAKTLLAGTGKIVTETLNYVDQKTDEPGAKQTGADKWLKDTIKTNQKFYNEMLDEASAEKEQFITYKAKDISNFSDFGSYMADLGTNQLPVYLTLAVAPELGSVLLGTSQAGDQFRSMEVEEMQPFAKQTSFGQKLLTSYVYGGAEAAFERLGTVNVIKNIEASIARASNASRRLIRDGAMQSILTEAKQFGFNFGLEGTTEYLTAEAQIQADRNITEKDVSAQKANENRYESFAGGALMGGGMSMVGGVWGRIAEQAKLYSDSKDIKRTTEILSEIQSLSDELKNNPNLTKEDKDIIHRDMANLANQSFEIVTKNAEKGKEFSKEENSFLVAVNIMQDGLKKEFEQIKTSNLSTEQKQAMTDRLNASFIQLEQNRQKTLKGEFSKIPDSEKVFKQKPPQEDNLIDDNVTPEGKQFNDIWVKSEKDIPTGKDRNPNDRYNVVSNSEELKLFQEQEKAKDVSLTNEANNQETTENTDANPAEKLQKATQEQFDNISLVETPDGTFNVVEKQENSSFVLKSGLSKEEADKFMSEINPANESSTAATATENLTDEDVLSGLEPDAPEAPAQEVAPTTETEVPTGMTDQEYLDFVDNDFLSDDRLNDIATKVRENKDLNSYEKRVANKKEKEISAINKKVEEETKEANRKAEVDALSKIPPMDKDEFLEYTKNEKATVERLSSIAYKKANNIEMNNFENEVYQDNKKAIDKINKGRDLKENILDKLPAEQKHPVKDGKYTVAKNGKSLELYDTNGQPASVTPKTKQKYFLEALENGFMKRNEPLQYPDGISQEEANRFDIENETDPSAILEKLQVTELNLDGAVASDFKDFAIASFINKVTQKSFLRFSDKNNITRSIALTYFSKEGQPIDTLAQEASTLGVDVTPQDVVDFILANPNGKRNILTVKNPEYQDLIDRFVELTGFAPTPSQIMYFKQGKENTTEINPEFAFEVPVNKEVTERIDLIEAAEEFDKWFSSLTPQEQVEFYFDLEEDYPNEYYQQRYNEQLDYEQSEKTTSSATPNGPRESQPNGGMGKNAQQNRRESGNNNVPERESSETQAQGGKVKPIRQLGTGSNVYYETDKYRVNELRNGKIGLVIQGEQDGESGRSVTLVEKKPEVAENVVKPRIEKAIEEKNNESKKSERKVRDEKAKQEIADALKEFLKAGRDNLTSGGLSPEKIEKGAKLIALYTKLGIYKFSDIVEDLYAQMGDALKDIYSELKAVYAAHYNTVEDAVADQMDANVRNITYESIITQKQDNEAKQEEPISDTKPIELKTKAIESKTDKLANDRETKVSTERKLEIANDLLFDIDNEIENINDQLRLLGVYEPSANDEMRENPHIYVERELKKDLSNFVKKLNEKLKWEFDTDKKGKPVYASANVAPAGGDGTFILWAPNSKYGVYVSLSVEPKEYKDWYEQYELRPTIMWRVTTKENKYTGLSNQWMNSEDFTIPNLVDKFTRGTNFYLKQENGSINNGQQPSGQRVSNPTESLLPNNKRPSENPSPELLPKPSSEQGTGSRSQPKSNTVSRTAKTVKQSATGQGDLFSGDANFLEVEPKKPAATSPTEKAEQRNIIALGKKLIDAVLKNDLASRADGKSSKEIGQVLLETLTLAEENILYNTNKEYAELYDISAQRELTESEKQRISEIYKAQVTNKQVALLGKLYQKEKEQGSNSDFVKAVDKLLEEEPNEPLLKSKSEVQVEAINQAEKQEPALVDFSMQDNEQEKFNAAKKYTDNINALQTLLNVITENRKATSEEKSILAKYVGFGGLKEIAFNPDNDADWKESTAKYKEQVRKVMELTHELDEALGINNSLSEIRAGILTAHYTPKTIIDTMFNVLAKLGFKDGNILEPSAGIGNFIGYMPNKMRLNSKITAVELDNITGNILKYLYDDVTTQIRGIQDAIIPDNSQDVVISNVPFGNFKVFDKAFKGNREFLTKRIHNYFFAKALDKAREGGIVMFVTSKGVLDSKGNQEVREYINQNAEFLGAVRLPSTAFQNNANTSVVTDIIILRKNTSSEKRNPNFIEVVDLEVTDKNGETKTVTINNFFKENRNVMLGEVVPGGMYSEKDYSLVDPNNEMDKMWERLISSNLRHSFGTFQPSAPVNATNRIETSQDLIENTKEGNLTINNEGKILKRVNDEMQEVTMPSYVKPRNVKKYIDVRVALFDLIAAEYSGQSDNVVEGLRTKLKSLYANAIQTIPAKEFSRIASEDADGFNVLSLTDKSGKKADILSKRTINPLQQKQNTESVDEAIIISLYENAKIDIDRIAELMNKPVKEVLESAKGKIFESPTGGYFTRDEYLSGNVKKKLAEVNKAIESGYTEFEHNKTELEAVIPKDIPSVSIEVRLGSRWVPLDIINDFADHLFKDDNVVINYAKSTDTYNNNGKAHSVNATEKWGTKRKNGADLLVDALHAATPAIYDTTEDGKRVLNQTETENAVQKFEEIRAEFENWVYTNAERRERLGQIYNEKYNTTVRRKYDGSHLNIPGINGVSLYPHQKDAIWMLLQNNGGIIDHIVGAGKTFVMVAGTAEMKRTGVAKKPIILALKSTIPQIVETYKQSYPLAKILSPSEKDFQAKNRQQLFSQIALNDWDIIIMSHENYQAIPHDPEYIRKQIDDEIAEIEAEREALSGDKKALSGLETRLKNLEAKLEKLTDVAKDNAVYFQQMGIDHIMVDESQQFKNLAYMTKQRNVAGLSKAEGSRRAFNLLVGIRYIQETLGADKGTTFLSGTPISNSMVEMYSLLKYLRPEKMKELGFNTFDQWATTFANPTNEIEYSVTGQFKSKTRFREFINVPELSMLYTEIADVRNDDNLVLDKPKMKGGGYLAVYPPMNQDQSDYGLKIIEFAKTKDGKVLGLNLSENQLSAYMLLATNLSSKMAIDMRLINKDYDYDPNGKVGKMTDEVVKVYNETNEHKGTQLIFSDLGTPKSKNNQAEMLKDYMEDELGVPQDTLVEIFGNFAEEGHKYQPINIVKQKTIDVLEIGESDFNDYMEQARQSSETFNLYNEVKKRLTEKGIPESEIVFIHDYNNQKTKEKLFEKVNAGEIRVVLGSTQKLGTGVNVQKRLAAIHHLDVPWRPSDMEQRNGRGVRQGNWIAKTHLNNEIPIYAYATERTLDGYKYQLLQTKQRFLDQVKSGSVEDRVIREVSEDGNDGFAMMVANLSGNKDILLRHQLDQEKNRLTKQKRNFEGSLYEAQGNIRKLESNIPAIEENASKTRQDIESLTNKAEYEVTEDKETGTITKKLKIDNINGEVLQPEKDSKEAKENKPVDRTEYGKKAIELIEQTVRTIKIGEYTKAFDINGIPILAKVTNKKEFSNGKEYIVQKRELAILSPSGQTYTVNNSTIPGVLLNNIQKAIEGIPSVLEMQEKVLEKNKKDLAGYRELAKNDKFPKEEELANITAELREVDKRIKEFENDTNDELNSENENIVNEPSEGYGKNSNFVLNKTEDGQNFLSLSEPGTEYPDSSKRNVQQEGDSNGSNNNRRTVRAMWTKYKNLQFKGTTKIQGPEDVAKIMSLLENKSNEHAFAIHIDQDGNSHIQFLSIGGITGTVVDPRLVSAGVSKFKSKKVYLVHNHPSGTMKPSNADLELTKTLREGLNPLGIIVEHIIMDTYLKQYVHIDNNNEFTVNTRGENTFTEELVPIDLSEQELLEPHLGKIQYSNDVFPIIQNFRFSAMPKNAMLVLNNFNQVIGNYVFLNGEITYEEILSFIGETATAVSVIFYGNQAYNIAEVNQIKKTLKNLSINVIDQIVVSSNNDTVVGYYESMAESGMLNEHHEQYGTGDAKFYELNEPSSNPNKDLRLPQRIARQALDQLKEDTRNNIDNNTKLSNAVAIVQNSNWYQELTDGQKTRVNNTTIKSLLENAIKEINYLEDKVDQYKQQLIDNKLTARQVFDDIIAYLRTNQIKGKTTPTEINRLIKSAAQIIVRKDKVKALDDFMTLYQDIKQKALLRSDQSAKEKAEVNYVVPMVEVLVANGYDLQSVVDYFDTNSQKRMAEIQYHKEKAKYATYEEKVNKTEEALKKQKQDLFNATYTSFREGLKKARLYWFNLVSDRSYVPANLMSNTEMQQTYYQFKNTKGYGHSAKEMYEKAYDKVWKGLTQEKIELLHDFIQMMRIITIDDNRATNGLGPVQHPNNLTIDDAKAWLEDQERTLGTEQFNDIQKRAKEYFKAYQEVLDLKLENGFISKETYDALNGLDYQPRMFLHHAVNFDGDLSFEQKQHIILRSGLSKEQIKGLEDGSANSLILDAQWLLSNSISTLYQDIADNALNRLFIAEEFPIAKEKYESLLSIPQDQLTKEERRFVKYFKELSDKVIPNEIIGFNANNNDPIYKNETPKNFVNKYYWADGVKHQFFMEEKLAQEFDGAKGLFLNESNKQVVGTVTGAKIVKWFATGNNPLFVIVNTPRDFMWNILVSEHYSAMLPLAMAQMSYQLFPATYDFIRTKLGRENTDMNLYLQHGGSMEYLHKQGQIAKKSFADRFIVKPLTSVLGKNNQPIVEDKVRENYISKGIGALNEWSELAFRIATFRRSINASLKELGFENDEEVTDQVDQNGIIIQTRKEVLDNIYRKATYDARSILDFSQGGRLVKDMEEFIPYFNVGVQATRSYADSMKRRPITTTLKTLQIAAGGAASIIALAMFMLAGDDDEPEEEAGKTVERKYIEFMQGVSEETRSKYYLIPTKQRDEKGNRIAYKIAKDQFLIPYTNIVETLIENRIRTRAGFKEVPFNTIGKRLYKDVSEYNLSTKSIKDVPLFKAGVAWYAGYDLYRNKPLDQYAKSEALEGMGNPQVEDFYKHLGMQFKISPIRTKSAIESIITSPQSNPYLATGYEVMDYAFTDKSMSNLGSGVQEMLLKGLKNRTTTKSTEWTRTENLLKDTREQQFDAMLREEAIRQLFKDKAEEVFDGETTDKDKLYERYTKAKEELKRQYGDDPNYDSYRKSFKRKFNEIKKAADTDNMMKKIKKERSPGARAVMIKQVYGDINSPKNAEIKKKLKKAGIINKATERYLDNE